jgi:phage gp29-like protein
MSKTLARLLSALIGDYIRINITGNVNMSCVPSWDYEYMEKKLIEGDFDAIETFIGARIRQPLKINNDE